MDNSLLGKPRRTLKLPLWNLTTMPSKALETLSWRLLTALAILASADQSRAAPKQVPDLCHAQQFLRFIGKPVTDLEAMHPPEARFVCQECAMTMDIQPSRLTVVYSKSGRITKLSCE
jgi:hypothetical protein